MTYSDVENRIYSGQAFLLGCQNSDGGISSEYNDDNNSGCWTTAEVMEAFLTSSFPSNSLSFLLDLLFYLLSNYKGLDNNMGYWGSRTESPTMTTGHVISSLLLCKNKLLVHYRNMNFTKGTTSFNVDEMIREIDIKTVKALNWLTSIKNKDNGWGRNINEPSNITCCYYALKAFVAFGLNASKHDGINLTCIFIENNLRWLFSHKINNDELANLLYGYIILKDNDFILKHNFRFQRQIDKLINKKWKLVYTSNSLNAKSDKLFIHNLPWLMINVILKTESYNHFRKLKKLVHYLFIEQNSDGSWEISKGQKKCNTWISAEAIIDLKLTQKRFQEYYFNVAQSKKLKKSLLLNVLLLIICGTGLIYYFLFGSISILALIIAAIGLISSIVTIIDALVGK